MAGHRQPDARQRQRDAALPNAASVHGDLAQRRRPDGSPISAVMPFGSLKQMNDTDMRALYAFLQTVAPVETGKR